jgi:hypothetical protein
MVDLMSLSDQVDKDFAIPPASSAIEGSLLIHWGGRRPFSHYAGETPSRS